MSGDILWEKLFSNKERAYLYNNYNFIRDVDKDLLFRESVLQPLLCNFKPGLFKEVKIIIKELEHTFILKAQNWESEYFGFSCFSIEFILYEHHDYKILRNAINVFIQSNLPPKAYCTINVPSEDIILVQALSCTIFNLVETRLNYFLKIDQQHKTKHLNNIKIAELKDIPFLRKVAIKMRNRFDRVHADPSFSELEADLYLAKFVEESVKGFADIVLEVVDENNLPFGFLAGNYPVNIAGSNISKLVLAAVDSSVQRGKLTELLHEMTYYLKLKSADYITTITQAANIPAIRVWESAGFKLFKVTHLYSLKND